MDRVCPHAADCPIRCREGRDPLPVWPTLSDTPIAMIIGEAPGPEEHAAGVGFIGKSGMELDMYLEKFAKVSRRRCTISNVVKCAPWKGKEIATPVAKEIAYCTSMWMDDELSTPYRAIAAVGAVATAALLGPVSLERVQGIPQTDERGRVIVPIYHPAYGLRSTIHMKYIAEGFRVFGEVVRGVSAPAPPEVEINYTWLEDETRVQVSLGQHGRNWSMT